MRTKELQSNDDVGSVYQIFMTPGAGVFAKWVWPYKLYSQNALFLQRSSSLLPGIDQTKYIYSNDDQRGFTQIVNFMTLGAGVLILGHYHISHYSELVFFSFNIQHVECYCVNSCIVMLLSYTMVDFHLFYDGSVDIQI